MSYKREDFDRIKTEFENKRINAIADAEARTADLHQKYPDIKAIDDKLRATSINIMNEAMKGKDGLEERIKSIEDNNLALQAERKALLQKYGLPVDCSDIKYQCPDCSDTGYIGLKMCHCFKAELAKCALNASGLGNLLKDQSFETFSLIYYKDNPQNYENMNGAFEHCRKYAENFSKDSGNLLLLGPTGLGKTHISTSIAKVVIEKGFDVVYDSAQNIFSDFGKEEFKNQNGLTDKYFNCDLLIIDDLGSEMHSPFSVSCLYNLVNTRLNSNQSMIINTNYNSDELRKLYTDRITSRFLGFFDVILFAGKDIRMQKLQRK